MSVDGKEHWLENRAIELFEEIQRKNPHLSWKEIDELCYKQAEEDYMNQPEVDYKKIQEEPSDRDWETILWLCFLSNVLFHLHS